MSLGDHMTDAAVAAAAKKVTVTGGTMAVTGWLTASNVLGTLGFLVAVAGLVVTWYYKHRDDLRRAERHHAQMELIRNSGKHSALCEDDA